MLEISLNERPAHLRMGSLLLLILSLEIGCVDKVTKDPVDQSLGTLWGVCVGINDFLFTATERNLKTAVNGAEEMAKYLASPRFVGSKGFRDRKITVLEDQGATISDVRSALSDSLKLVSANDWVVLYFATHGLRDPNNSESAHLICHDTEALEELNRLRGSSVDMTFLVPQIAAYSQKAERVVVVIDACRAGATVSNVLNKLLNSAFSGTALPRVTVLTASTNDYAMDNAGETLDGREYSAFSHLLFKALKDGGLPGRGPLSFGDIYRHIKAGLKDKQKPNAFGDLDATFFRRDIPLEPLAGISIRKTHTPVKIRPSKDSENEDEPGNLRFLLDQPLLTDFPYYFTKSDYSNWDGIERKDGLLSKTLKNERLFEIDDPWKGRYKVIAGNLAYLARATPSGGTGKLEEAKSLYERAIFDLRESKDAESTRLLCIALKRKALCNYMMSSRHYTKKANPLKIAESRSDLLRARELAIQATVGDVAHSMIPDIDAALIACSYETYLYFNDVYSVAPPDSRSAAEMDLKQALDTLRADKKLAKQEGGWLAECVELFEHTLLAFMAYSRKALDPEAELAWLAEFRSRIKSKVSSSSPDFRFNTGTLELLIGIGFADHSRWKEAADAYNRCVGALRDLDQHPGLLFFRSDWQLLIQSAECKACLCQAYQSLPDSLSRVEALYQELKSEVSTAFLHSNAEVRDYLLNQPNEFHRLDPERLKDLMKVVGK